MGSQVKKKKEVCRTFVLPAKEKDTTATNCYEIRSCSIHGERGWEGPLTPVIKGLGSFSIHGERDQERPLPSAFFFKEFFFM
jgi:hypothetical protein